MTADCPPQRSAHGRTHAHDTYMDRADVLIVDVDEAYVGHFTWDVQRTS